MARRRLLSEHGSAARAEQDPAPTGGMSEAQNFWLWLLRYGYASAPQPQPKIPEESMINLLNLTDTTDYRARVRSLHHSTTPTLHAFPVAATPPSPVGLCHVISEHRSVWSD